MTPEVIAVVEPVRTLRSMTNNILPGIPGHNDPRHEFLSGKEVIARFGWGRTYGYQMLNSTGFPKPIGGRYRLDTLMAWEDRVLAGELAGRPDPQTSVDSSAETDLTAPTDHNSAPGSAAVEHPDDAPVPAPTRRRTRGARRAA